MPWNECKPMDERLKFIARLLDGEKMSPLCREFGISRVMCIHLHREFTDHQMSLNIHIMTARSGSRVVDGFASVDAKSTLVPCLLAKLWGLERSLTRYGLSALWIMI